MFERKKEDYQQQSSQTETVTTDTTQAPQPYTTLDAYSLGHSSPIPEVYAEMEYNTKALIPSGSHMVSGQAQGRLLKQLASMTREGRILELGTFTGYATACLWEGSIEAGKLSGSQNGSRSSGTFVLSMERDARAYDVAASHLQIISEHGFRGDDAMEAMCSLRATNKDITKKGRVLGSPIANIDDNQSVTFSAQDGVGSCELMKVSDGLATLEEMALKGQDQKENPDYIAPFDMVFIDADKTRLVEYVNACLETDNVLKKGGLIVVDNVLWKGLVLEASGAQSAGKYSKAQQENDDSDSDSSDSDSDTDANNNLLTAEVRKNRRARKLANKMHRFNSAIVQDNRVEVLVLPIRDGLSIIRKK
jgi:predicted O-methyltransferase YrrM